MKGVDIRAKSKRWCSTPVTGLSASSRAPAHVASTTTRLLKQRDLFELDAQPALFPEEAAPVLYRADPDKVRVKLQRILAEARAAATMPWSAERLGYHQPVFPQMSRWLPGEEAAQLCFEFETEIRRLIAA